jgi:hypothetical protein
MCFLNDVLGNDNEFIELEIEEWTKNMISCCSILGWDILGRDLNAKEWHQPMVINNKGMLQQMKSKLK